MSVSIHKLKNRKSNNQTTSTQNSIYNQYIQEYKYYFYNAINKCKYQDKYDSEISGQCIILDVTNMNENKGDEKWITTLPNSKIEIGTVLRLEFSKDLTTFWIVQDKENLAIPSHDKYKISPLFFEAKLLRNNMEELIIDTKVVNKDSDLKTKFIYYSQKTNLKAGDYVCYPNSDNVTYLITDTQKFKQLPFGNGMECNNILKAKSWGNIEIPCVMRNSSYGSKGELHNNEYMSDFDSRGIITCQRNKYTDSIFNGMRFCFNGTKDDIVEITKKSSLFLESCWELTFKSVKYVQEDDLENNYAFNPRLDGTSSPNDEVYIITGEEYVKHNTESTYTINNKQNKEIIWTLDEDSIDGNLAEIINQDNNKCILKVTSKEEMIQLIASDKKTNETMCSYVLYGVR
ncbi:hypothetical protein FC831_10770 [Clostridium botulinum]|nr:hypothetical protein [Clostridium botulinum]